MGCGISKEEGASATTTSRPGKGGQEEASSSTTRFKTARTSSPTNNNNNDTNDSNGDVYVDEDGGTMFFDAVDNFADIVGSLAYPPASTPVKGKGVSILIPETLLTHKNNTKEDETAVSSPTNTNNTNNNNKNSRSVRDSVAIIKDRLSSHAGGNIVAHGYPGELTDEELEACLEFRNQLKQRDPAFKEMVAAYSPAEEESFALCRFLRAREFNVAEVFNMLDGNGAVELWKKARANNFYREFEQIYNGCPVPVFMILFPVVISGLAKNGATMLYFKPGGIDINALECVADVPNLVPMAWDLLHNKGTDSMVRESQCHDPETTTTLSERIIVVDMKNMPAALFNTEFLKEAAKITACFPETMNRTYMINVPTAFSLVWAVVKLFLEPRTIRKIGFFARESKARQDLLEFVASEELLADYGGTGPFFSEVLKKRQQEYGSGCSRYIVETMAVTRKESLFDFELSNNEEVSAIVVYSKGDGGATISITKKNCGTTVVESTTVKRNDGSDKIHYHVKLDTSKFPVGEGSFTVNATGRSVKEHYLVAISVCMV